MSQNLCHALASGGPGSSCLLPYGHSGPHTSDQLVAAGALPWIDQARVNETNEICRQFDNYEHRTLVYAVLSLKDVLKQDITPELDRIGETLGTI